jgi:hypothetical protein
MFAEAYMGRKRRGTAPPTLLTMRVKAVAQASRARAFEAIFAIKQAQMAHQDVLQIKVPRSLAKDRWPISRSFFARYGIPPTLTAKSIR